MRRYTAAVPDATALETAFHSSERKLWGLCYRMTGVAADADELVQEAFARAAAAGSSLAGVDLERWLVRVATNLSIDCLRRRKRRPYHGSWLPSPVEFDERLPDADLPDTHAVSVDRRIELAEQVSYALLVALEALSPRARAALILIDVLDWSAAEAAGLLGTTEGNVRVLHHRARRTIQFLDIDAAASPAGLRRQTEALERFVICMMQQDADAMAALLAEDVRSITDGGGRYTALREPLTGKAAVIRFHLETARRRAPISRSELRVVNGAAAFVVATQPARPQMAPQLVLRCEVDEDGSIVVIQTVLAPRKLTAVRFLPPPVLSV